MVGFCDNRWIVVLADLSLAVVIRKIFFICKLCDGMCVVGIGGGVNDGCGGSSLVNHQQQHHHHFHHNVNDNHHHLNHTAYT